MGIFRCSPIAGFPKHISCSSPIKLTLSAPLLVLQSKIFLNMGITTSLQKTDQPITTTKKHIFILSGQSNMAGRGGVKNKQWDRIVPDSCKPVPSTIHRLNANLIYETAKDPLHADIDTTKVCGVGPGMSFANSIKDHVKAEINLVPCAIGGTAIKEWDKGQKLYENMITRAKAAAANGGGEIKAVLWYQGESDTWTEYDAESYKANMENLIHNIRSDLCLPTLPIIQVALASCHDERYIEIVRTAQKAIDLPNVVCVDAKGLELKEDNLHLTTAAQVQLGHMLADAYLKHFG